MTTLSPKLAVTLLEIFKYHDGEHPFYKKLKHHVVPFIPKSIADLTLPEQIVALLLVSQTLPYWQLVIQNSKQKYHTGSTDHDPVPSPSCDFYYIEFILDKHFDFDLSLKEYRKQLRDLERVNLIDVSSFEASTSVYPSQTLYQFLEQFYYSEIYSKCL